MGSTPVETTKILIVGREDDGSGLLIHRSENSNIGSNPILSARTFRVSPDTVTRRMRSSVTTTGGSL